MATDVREQKAYFNMGAFLSMWMKLQNQLPDGDTPMRAELHIHFTDPERDHIATAVRIAGKTGTRIASGIRKELGLKPWDHADIDRIFQQAPEAGYSKGEIIATDLLLGELQGRLRNHLESPDSFMCTDDGLDAFIAKTQQRIETVSSVRHLLANALTPFAMFED